LNPDGGLMPRGEKIIEHTPMGRFGVPEDSDGVLLFLCSDMSSLLQVLLCKLMVVLDPQVFNITIKKT